MPFPTPLLLALTAEPVLVERGVAPAAALTFFTTSTWIALWRGQKDHAPKACRWCRSNSLDEGVRTALLWKKHDLADTLSNIGLAVTPAFALGSLAAVGAADHRLSGFDTLVVTESTMVAMLVNQLVKLEVARARPYVHHRLVDHPSSEDNLSFFSGHTTWGFASAVAAGNVASMRGYRGAPAVWAGSLAFAVLTGYLRVGADKHWFSDVMAGAVIGALAGAIIPRLHLVEAPTATATASAASAIGAAPTWITVGGVF